MAPPKSSWSKLVSNATTAQNVKMPLGKSPPKGKNAKTFVPPAPPTDTYSAAQEDEIEVLKAIYMEDFEEVEAKGAWSKTTDRALRLKVKSFSDNNTYVVLSVKLTATYPKTLPTLILESTSHLRHKTQENLQRLLASRPKELLGDVMIHDIATSVQDLLEDDVTARENEGTLPSLEEERAVHEAAAAQLAKQHEEELQKKRNEEKAEEERTLQQMVSDEMRRKELMVRRKSRGAGTPMSSYFTDGTSANHVSFDRMIMLSDGNDNIEFSAVEGLLPFKTGPVTEELLVKPSGVSSNLTMVLKQTHVGGSKQSSHSQLKKAILEFEEEMEDLKRLRQPNVMSVFDFKIEPSADSGWEINILVELCNKGSLAEKLEDDNQIAVAKVRSWTIELLEAADYYHRNGVVHKRIHPHNVLLFKPPNGSISVKLADAGFQETLYTLKDLGHRGQPLTTPRSAFWVPPELAQEGRRTRKTDVWDLGVVFVQMLFGLEAPQKYSSPQNLMDTLQCSEPLQEIIGKFFKPDPKSRPSAFDLIPCEFLRDDVPIYDEPPSPMQSRLSLSGFPHNRLRRSSSAGVSGALSRYANEWVEAGRLGKGGYGEVVKARNKVDGRIYAIKKIKQKSPSALTEVLSEVMLLSRLNHPYVVRYYTAWPEEEFGAGETEDDSSVTWTGDYSNVSPGDTGDDIEFGRSTGGLDFISSSGLPKIEFEGDSDEDEDDYDDGAIVFGEDTDEDDETESVSHRSPLRKRRTNSSSHPTRSVKTILYIQMEFCEKQTLRDLIRRGLYDDPDEYWRLFRQILEGLAHIHSHGIIHRDLKPDNIFIDVAKIPKIGDFGLATSGQYQRTDKATIGSNQPGDMTRSIGTALYVAPELRSTVGGNYNDKVDMYSIGIIFFEMCYPLTTAMERDHVIRRLRERQHTLPPEFDTPEKSLQGNVITSLISHRPSERPSCGELLRSGKVPLQIEDEAVKEALKALSDRNSPHYQKMMAALFSQKPDNQVKDYAWDLNTGGNSHGIKPNDVLLQSLVKDRLTMVFRSHGAVETQRQVLLPWSAHYANNNVVKLFDPSGTLVQLPYDLTLPYARSIGRGAVSLEKTYTIGSVYRDTYTGGAPRSSGEADFDILSYDTLDLALKEAEVLKVIDEIIEEFPSLASAQMCFHLNHSDLLEMIMDFARINVPQRPIVKEVLSKLNIQDNNWQKIRNELRAPEVGVSSTSLDDLARFDWRDTPEKAFSKLRRIFEGTKYLDKTHAVFAHLSSLVNYTKHWGIKRKVYVNPLSSVNEKFYTGSVLFQCLFDSKKREVLAAGGRYDRLIEEYRPKVQGQGHHTVGYHAVGMNLGWDRLVNSMARYLRKPTRSTFLKKRQAEEDTPTVSWMPRRCDCLVASFDATVLRSTGVKMVADLISHGYTAELAIDAHSLEDLLRHYRDDRHSWVIVIKHSVTSDKPDLKVKSMAKKEDMDIRSADLLNYLRNELRDRDLREGSAAARQPGSRIVPTPTASSQPAEGRANVDVLLASHRSKKSSKWSIVEAAQARSSELLTSFHGAPIAAIETKDEVMNLIRETRLSDPDSWRRCIQSLPLAERKYLQELHDMLLNYASRWKQASAEGNGRSGEGGKAFVYNFRTGGCLLYDLEN
ncbi:kinase-like protein [Delitschia confertaspora ATCC 74209]|uniref:non-specific serine/threonine protein kinase n=1 Tax=Delitschia confertaspora ATCC 74209 TaxID=1513339 RepID=A0A9P4MTD1_9PLEO|nr:kinase-like protein [Delitschia confertaspora ATCC 74209]